MSIYLNYNAHTARIEAENLARVQYDVNGIVVRPEPLRTRLANALRRVADLQLTLASRLDAEPTAA